MIWVLVLLERFPRGAFLVGGQRVFDSDPGMVRVNSCLSALKAVHFPTRILLIEPKNISDYFGNPLSW